MSRSRDFFKRLLSEPGVSGYEENAQRIWREHVATFAPEIHEHPHGALTARIQGASDYAVMLVGHMDEIGLMVKHVEENGFLRVASVGGVRRHLLQSQRVRIVGANGMVNGVVGAHSETNAEPAIEDLFIDIGAKDKEEASKRVELGDPMVVGDGWIELDNNLAACRNFDNRVGCYIVAEVLRELSEGDPSPVTVLGVSSVQEETGGPGAGQSANHWKPDEAIAFDVTWASDYPSASMAKLGDVRLGGGPVLIRGVRTNQAVYERLRSTSERHGIPWQVETETGRTYTDADPIAAQHGGVPVSVVSVPCRYMHSSTEVVSLDDVDNIVKLLVAYLSELEL